MFNDTVIVQPEFRQKLYNAKTKQRHFNADFLESSCFYVTCIYFTLAESLKAYFERIQAYLIVS